MTKARKGFISGKTTAQYAYVTGRPIGKHFQDSTGSGTSMNVFDWLEPLHPVSRRHAVFGAPDANKPR